MAFSIVIRYISFEVVHDGSGRAAVGQAPHYVKRCTIIVGLYQDGSPYTKQTLDLLNIVFTILFVAELLLNLLSNWLHPFLANCWPLFIKEKH
jgi:hypothetical protein